MKVFLRFLISEITPFVHDDEMIMNYYYVMALTTQKKGMSIKEKNDKKMFLFYQCTYYIQIQTLSTHVR